MSLGKAGTRKYRKAMNDYVAKQKIPKPPIPSLTGDVLDLTNPEYQEELRRRVLQAPAADRKATAPGSTARKAADVVSGSRQTTHGSAPEQFTDVAQRWRNHILLTYGIDVPLVNTDVGWMMADLKRSRAKYGEFNEDDYVDCIGYVDCVAQCIDR